MQDGNGGERLVDSKTRDLWLRHQIETPQDSMQMRAAMLGKYDWEREPTINSQGFTIASANPPAGHFEQDLMMITGERCKGLYDKNWVVAL